MLKAFGIIYGCLHNRGNNAVYTLAAARHVLAIAGSLNPTFLLVTDFLPPGEFFCSLLLPMKFIRVCL